jgi:serine/threonine protein kinase
MFCTVLRSIVTGKVCQNITLLEPTARSLHELHHIGVAHRDLSLENFLVADNASLRLTDFEA